MSIYVNQRIPLKTSFTEVNDAGETVAVDITAATIRYDYWLPTNKTDIPSGSVDGVVEDGTAGSASGSIPLAENTVDGVNMRIQANAIFGADEWPAITTTNVQILKRGS